MSFTCSPSEDLFTHSSILSMCTVESTHLRSAPQFKDLCETKGPVDCCPGWNVGGYVALLFNRSSCFGITVRCQTQVFPHKMHGEKTNFTWPQVFGTKINGIFYHVFVPLFRLGGSGLA